ncbi:DUF6314 family protein [Angustibacter aerolatus]|nr:DUF6314 family protein [Angustibacter aerolatus]
MRRTLHDRLLGADGTAGGEARFSTVGDDVRWAESGRFTWLGAERPFRRVLWLRATADGWCVEFEDGRPFHDWAPGAWAEHRCGADLYRGLVDATATGFAVTWHARGPAKDYTSTTTYERVPDPR